MFQLPLNISLDSSATLDSFYVGENIELLERLMKLTKKNNLIFISGNQGAGKSHLAQAVCNEISSPNDQSCVYLPLNNSQLTPAILLGLSQIDLVCLDNIESIANNHQWQVGLFNLYNEIKDTGNNLIIFSDRSPVHLGLSLKDLESRLSAMSIFKLKNINEENLIHFIIEQGENLGMQVSLDVATFILNRSERSILELKTIIKTLDEQSLAHQRRITIPFVKDILNI